MRLGPDVSDWQEGVDWPAVVGAGATFGVAKATEGTGNVQATLDTNRANMADAGMVAIGLYHFARPENGNPTAQAQHFLNMIGPLRPREFVVLDIETGDQSMWPGFIADWCDTVARSLGVTPVVYMSESPAGSMPDSCARWPLWDAGYVARYPTSWDDPRLGPVGPWALDQIVMWQFTSSYRIDGITGDCDMNIAPDDLPVRLGLTNQEDDVALTADEKYAISLIPGISAAMGRVEVAVRDQTTGLGAKLDQIIDLLTQK